MWILWLAAPLLLIAGVYYCYRQAFYVDRSRLAPAREIPAPFTSYREAMLENIDKLLALPYAPVSIQSRDGLTLRGQYYAGAEGAPLVLFFHGFHSAAVRDGSGGFWYCREKGYGVLLAEQRGHGDSEGRFLTFGVREREDCLAWAQEAVRRCGPDVRILLAGISMGAATVLSAAELPLPEQVKGIWADCGYTDAESVILLSAQRRHMPLPLIRPLLPLTARLFCGFRLADASPLNAVAHTRLPILLIHGEKDSMVPVEMAYRLRDACAGPVTLLTVPDAEHGISYYVDMPAYRQALDAFCTQIFP